MNKDEFIQFRVDSGLKAAVTERLRQDALSMTDLLTGCLYDYLEEGRDDGSQPREEVDR